MLLLPLETRRQGADRSSLPSNSAVRAGRMEQPSSNASLPSDQPDTSSPVRMAMHINGGCEVSACPSRLHAWRDLGGLHGYGVDPSLRLFQELTLHQQHHELKFWGGGVIEKARGGEVGMVSVWRPIFPLVRRVRLLLITRSDPGWRFGNSGSHHLKFVVAIRPAQGLKPEKFDVWRRASTKRHRSGSVQRVFSVRRL